MKRSALLLLVMMVMGSLLLSCYSKGSCPAYNSSTHQPNPDVEEQCL